MSIIPFCGFLRRKIVFEIFADFCTFFTRKAARCLVLPDGSSAPFCLFLRWSAVSDKSPIKILADPFVICPCVINRTSSGLWHLFVFPVMRAVRTGSLPFYLGECLIGNSPPTPFFIFHFCAWPFHISGFPSRSTNNVNVPEL